MAKRFSPEFKQQAIEYALANLHESLAAIARKFRQLRKEDILLMAGLVQLPLSRSILWFRGIGCPQYWPRSNILLHFQNTANLSVVGQYIIMVRPDFDARNYGRAKLSGLIKMLNLFDTKIEGSQMFLKKTKNNLVKTQ